MVVLLPLAITPVTISQMKLLLSLHNWRYQIGAKLGAGGMGYVYQAYDRLMQQHIALKQLTVDPADLVFAARPASSPTLDSLVNLAQEFRLLASLRHPHIINVLDYGFDSERKPYFTMELLPQPQTILQAGREQTLAVQVDLLSQLLQALIYLHRRGILHRDLKPENALVTDGHLRVLDFGLSVTLEQACRAPSAGTLLYMAPEVFLGQPVSPASDLYAVGVMAYELLTGRHPFYCTDLDNLVEQWLNTEVDLTPLADLPALASVVGKLLVRQAEDRYQQASEVIGELCAAVQRSVPTESVAIRESFLQAANFVGRDEDLAGLAVALAAAQRGRGSAWLVGGESGVGKSRLLDELRIRALVEGVVVLRGQAVEGGGLPYQLWREPLRRLLLTSELSDREAGVLKPIVPDIANLLGRTVSDAPELEGQAAQQRLRLTIVDLFKRQTQPVLLLLEDLQWSTESLAALRTLLRWVGELPLLIIGSYRDDERPHLPDELPEARLLKLQRLSQPAIAELSAVMLGEAGQQPHFVEFIEQETEGNTFFIVEAVRALAEEAGGLGDIDPLNLPHHVLSGGMKALLRRRLAQVPLWAQPVLKLAAVIGRRIDRQVLTTTSPNLTWESWLTACGDAAVLDSADGHWRFAHDKLRETLLADLAADERPLLHRRVAQALEICYPHDVAYAEALADHWERAGEPSKALPYLVQAAQYLVIITADYPRAEELILRGLASDEPTYRAPLLHLWGESRYYRSDFSTAAAHYQACLQASSHDPNLQVTAYNGLSRVLWKQGNLTEAQGQAQQALVAARALNDAANVAESLYNLGWIAYLEGNFPQATTYLEESLAIWRARQDQRGISWLLSRLAGVFFQCGEYIPARHYVEESLRICHEIGDRFGITSALTNLGLNAKMRGNYAESHHYYTESLALFRAVGNRDGVALTLNNLGNLAINEGDFVAARCYLHEGLQLEQELNNRMGIARCQRNLGFAAYMCGEDELALHHLAESLAIRSAIGQRPGIIAVQADRVFPLLRLRDYPAARAALVEALHLALDLAAAPHHVHALLASAYYAQAQSEYKLAATWVGLLNHAGRWEERITRLLQTLAVALENRLGADCYATACAHGQTLDLATAVQNALARFG